MMASSYDRQASRLTTVSAPPGTIHGTDGGGGKMKRLGRFMKSSVADFFGVGDEDPKHGGRWGNRRRRYAGAIGKLKDQYSRPQEDEVDSPRVIIDPLRVPGRQPYSDSDHYSRRSTPLSSTSTYHRSIQGLPRRRTRKDSVMKMTWKGITTLARARKKFRNRQGMKSRSYAPASFAGDVPEDDLSFSPSQPVTEDAFSLVDDVFYDEPLIEAEPSRLDKIREESDTTDGTTNKRPLPGWRRQPPQPLPSTPGMDIDEPDFGLQRIGRQVMDTALQRNKRHLGMGFVGRLLNRSVRSLKSEEIKHQLDEIDDHRPYFTYWVTFVQIVVFIVALAVYGIAPVGISETVFSEIVRMPNLAMQLEDHREQDNLWIGPRQADLIHLGAKYSPCMRYDENLNNALALDTEEEKGSACCVRNDGSGCAQMTQKRCSSILSTFAKWTLGNPGPDGRLSGSVCGQDPRYCTDPASVPPFDWDHDDITKWPICKTTDKPNRTLASQEDRHMNCEVVGHPCCHGIQGECIMTTREHCKLKRGYYHEDAFLCSQVKCMEQICGMIAFTNPVKPDQFYRLWTSIFLHGGLFHLVITVGFQMLVMRDMEKLAGAIRTAIIYLASGIAGNLASCIFLPYQVEAGPSGSQFGILACLLVEVIQSWQMYRSPAKAILKLAGPIIVLFLLGLLPWFDNWAHLFGFVFGFFLAFALLPYVSFGEFDKHRKLISIVVCLGAAIGLFVLLVILFYVLPLSDCPGCQYFNCIPFTADFCQNMQVSIKRNSTYSKF